MGKYRNLLLNTGVFATAQVATKLITFLLVPLYTSYLTTGEFGVTDMASTVITLSFPLLTLSISDAVLRFAIDDRDNAAGYVGCGLAVVLAGCLAAALASPLLDLPFFGGLGAYKGFFVAAFATNALQYFLGLVARANGHVKAIPVASAISTFVTAGLAVALIAWAGMRADGYFISLIVGYASGVAVYLVADRDLMRQVRAGLDTSRLRPMLSYAIPMIPNALFWWMGTSINRFFITGLLGIAASGLFAAASKIPNLVNTVCNIFQQAWQLSAFQEYREEGREAFFATIFKLFNGLIVVTSSLIVLAAPLLASLLLQREFYSGWTLIPPILLASYLNTMNTFYGTIFTTTMQTRHLFTSTVAGAVTCVVLTYLLLGQIGLPGAALAMCVSNAVVWAMRVRSAREFIRIEVNWVATLGSLAVLAAQSAAVMLELPHFGVVSATAFLLVCVVQIRETAPILRGLARSFLSRRRGSHV